MKTEMPEVAALPKRAGKVVLEFDTRLSIPERLNRLGGAGPVRFPLREGMQVHSLQGGQQVLVSYPGVFQHGSYSMEGWNFFAGEDEQAFLSVVDSKALWAFEEHGEAGFYDALKPQVIKDLSELLPDAKVGRQGDIWYISLGESWEKVGIRKHDKGIQTVWQLFETSHTVKGYAGRGFLKIGTYEIEDASIVQGLLEAPDHSPHDLGAGPHFVARSSNLAKADQKTMQELGWD